MYSLPELLGCSFSVSFAAFVFLMMSFSLLSAARTFHFRHTGYMSYDTHIVSLSIIISPQLTNPESWYDRQNRQSPLIISKPKPKRNYAKSHNTMAGKRQKSPVVPEEKVVAMDSAKRAREDEKTEVTPSPRKRSARGDTSSAALAPTSLFRQEGDTVPVTPSPQRRRQKAEPTAKQRLAFGRHRIIPVSDDVRKVYQIVRQRTGSIGGNASHGPIYGELTMGSMQKIINLLKQHTVFDSSSRFIDVGSGIAKPNLHVGQDPGVDFSYGIEVDHDRWLLGFSCLRATLSEFPNSKVYLDRADIQQAKSFNPFTHVYMFSIGFPPKLWIHLAKMWNTSSSPYLICYHSPKDIIDAYQFNVELVIQTSTSMHGSSEGHMGYIYKRSGRPKTSPICDALYQPAWDLVKAGPDALGGKADQVLEENLHSKRKTRSSRRC